ncbi:hypothetical protein G7068_09805 [Leucobacter viscericola]|uniref:Uncharacterized protein n=1 Tax=Leucobacter viscericola TaxID=2714935 RepID=A0A6G7XGF8_9MICO|nr:hypothetical protein [Leucobacter viscericola]QIK63461.1 hypothetical protein G7068_09805 [Leucobacter viscericola]
MLEHLAMKGRGALVETRIIIGVLRTSDEKLDGSLDDSGYNVPLLENLVEGFVPLTCRWCLYGRVSLRLSHPTYKRRCI